MTLVTAPAPMTNDERMLLLCLGHIVYLLATAVSDDDLFQRLYVVVKTVENAAGVTAEEVQAWQESFPLPPLPQPKPKPKPWWRFWA